VAISLASLKKTSAKPNPLILLYGVEGVGKDTLAAEFPAPILIQTAGENPPAGVEIDTFGELGDFESFMSAFEALFAEEHSYQTLIISAIDGVSRIIEAETCRREGWNSIEDPGYGKGYIAADAVWQEFLEPLRQLGPAKGMTVILIGHTEIKNFDDPASSSYSRYQPNLQKRAADMIKAASDIIAFVNHRVTIKKEKGAFGSETKEAQGAGVRVIYLEERPGFIAKNRYDMPAEIQFVKGKGYSALAKFFAPEPAKADAKAAA
jgi:hypothetical protein